MRRWQHYKWEIYSLLQIWANEPHSLAANRRFLGRAIRMNQAQPCWHDKNVIWGEGQGREWANESDELDQQLYSVLAVREGSRILRQRKRQGNIPQNSIRKIPKWSESSASLPSPFLIWIEHHLSGIEKNRDTMYLQWSQCLNATVFAPVPTFQVSRQDSF